MKTIPLQQKITIKNWELFRKLSLKKKNQIYTGLAKLNFHYWKDSGEWEGYSKSDTMKNGLQIF